MTKPKKSSPENEGEFSAVALTAAETADKVRQEIRDVIVASSLDMTKSVVRAVKRRGSAASMRFLWSIAGIMQEPVSAPRETDVSSLQTLMDKLGLYEKPSAVGDHGDAEVKSKE